MKKKVSVIALFIFCLANIFPIDYQFYSKVFPNEPELLWVFKEAYPDVKFDSHYDFEAMDWKITITNYGKESVFYWNKGSMIPYEELKNKDKY